MKEHYVSPFDSDAEAQEVIDGDDMVGKWFADWTEYDGNYPAEIAIDGKFSLAELLAIIHFHPELKRRRDAGIPEPKSDEVRVLELSVQKLTEHLNALLEVMEPQKTEGQTFSQQAAALKREIMKARACLPAGYSMSLTKEKG